jgi:hypothetical protein
VAARRLTELHPHIAWQPLAAMRSATPEIDHPATRLLAVCPQGVPLEVLAGAVGAGTTHPTWTPPDWPPSACIPPASIPPAWTPPAWTPPAGTPPAGTQPDGPQPAWTDPVWTPPDWTDSASTPPAGTPAAWTDPVWTPPDWTDPAWRIERGFDGRLWAYLPLPSRRVVLARMPQSEQCLAHASLFRAWPTAGWDYLRRAVHAWRSHDPALIAAQATAIGYATRSLGPVFAARHIEALQDCGDRLGLSPTASSRLSANLARLMPDNRDGTPARGAARYLRCALRQSTTPGETAERLYDLANHHARCRRPADLLRARRYYAIAFPLLPSVADEEERIRKEIRLLNGLALVAYHERDNAEALRLEQRAHALADAAAARFPAVAEWARPLLNTNTAKLLVQRFADGQAAAHYLRESATSSDARVRRKATLDLARLAFDAGDADQVVALLSSVYDTTLPDENEVEEAIGRAMFAIACLALGRTDAAAQAIARVDYISRVLGLAGGQGVVDAVRTQLAAAGPRGAPAAAGR